MVMFATWFLLRVGRGAGPATRARPGGRPMTTVADDGPMRSPSRPPQPADAPARGAGACLAAVVLIFAWLLVYHYHHQTRGGGGHLGDFPTFYLAAEHAREHRDLYTAGTSPAMMY